MRKTFCMWLITGFLVLVLTYQPPVIVHAKASELNIGLDKSSIVNFRSTEMLLDSIKNFRQSIDSLVLIRQEIENGLDIIKHQQQLVIKQRKLIENFLITSN